MPPPVVFVLGLLADLLGLAPLGCNVLTLLVMHGLAVQWRRVLSEEAHRASLSLPSVKAAIAEEMPILSGVMGGFRFQVAGSPLR